MSKIIAFGDLHGRSVWKLIMAQHPDADRFICVGDYFDTHEDISGELQMINFRELCQTKEKEGERLVLLIGNHDDHYFPFMGYSGTSGYQSGAAPAIGHLLMTYKDMLKMAHMEGNILFTHAGVGEIFLGKAEWDEKAPLDEFLNDMWHYKPNNFKFTGDYSNTGDDECQTPIWIRPRSLMKASQNLKKQGIIQICGHTQQNSIDIQGKSTGGKYFFIDTLGTSGEYLIITNGEFSVGKI